MKIPVLVSPKFLKVFTFGFASGITLFPFIIVSSKKLRENKVLINHEMIHIRQQLEMLILPFYLWYGIEYLIKRIKLKDHNKAYRALSFEREAYRHEKDLHYLKVRKWYSFLKFL